MAQQLQGLVARFKIDRGEADRGVKKIAGPGREERVVKKQAREREVTAIKLKEDKAA